MVLQAQFGDAFDLCAGGGEFGGGVVGDAGLEGLQDRGLGVVAHGDDEGEAVLGDIGVVQALEACCARRRSGRRGRPWPVRRCFRASGAWRRRVCRQGRGGPCRTPSRSSGEAERNMRVSALCRPVALSWAGPSSRSKARSAIQGECSKMPPKRVDEAVARPSGWGARSACADGLLPNAAAMSMRRGNQTPSWRFGIVEEALQPRDLAGAADQAAVQADGEHLGLRPPRLRRRGCRSCPSGTGRTARP